MNHPQFEHDLNVLEQRYFFVLANRWIVTSLVLTGFVVMVALGLDRFSIIETGAFQWWLMPISAVVAGLWVVIRKKPFLSELVEADRRLGSKDLLASACEVFLNNDDTRFSKRLLDSAARFVKQTGPKIIFPKVSFLPLIIVPVFVGFSFFLILTTPPGMPDPKVGSDMTSQLIEHVALFKKGLMAQDDQKEQQKRFNLIEKTAAQMLKSGEDARKSAARSFSGLLETIASKNSEDMQQLKEQLNMDNSSDGMNIPNPVKGPKRRRQQQAMADLEKLKDQIEKAFDDKMPEHLSRQLADIEANEKFAQHLENLLKRYGQPPEEDKDDREFDSPQDKDSGRQLDRENRDNTPHRKGKGDPGSGRESVREGSLIPQERKKAATRLTPAKGRMVMDKAGDFKKGSFGHAVKALSAIGSTPKPEQEIKKIYIRQNEAVMQKESIPPEYKESIRDYFLSIGLEGEQ